MEEKICRHCKHFHQHYVINTQMCIAINCGHCVYPRIKHMRAEKQACKHFTEREAPQELPDRSKVTHFLTTEFLEHVMSYELPPEIIDPL